MRRKNTLAYYFFILLFFLTISTTARAQSNVYVLLPSLPLYGTVSFNGSEPIEIKGDIKKVKSSASLPYDLITYTDCYRKCIIKEEGKVLLSYTGYFKNVVSGDIYNFVSEIQIDVEDGNSYYVKIDRHGFNDQKLTLISEKSAQKFFRKKGCVMLPDYSVESL